MEHIDNQAPDSGVVVCPQCRKDTSEHFMIWDGEKNTVCLWCDEAEETIDGSDYNSFFLRYYTDLELGEPNPYHGTYSEE